MSTAAYVFPVALPHRARPWRPSASRRLKPALCAQGPSADDSDDSASTAKTKSSKAEQLEKSALQAAAATVVLKRATESQRSRRPSSSTVANALQQLEKQQRRNKATTDINELVGQWELVFTSKEKTSNPLERPMYFPIRARQTFKLTDSSEQVGTFNNGIFVAGSSLRFQGPFRWVSKANRLEFTFTSLTLRIGPLGPFVFNDIDKKGNELGERTAKVLPFFTFFLARRGIATARGRGGGLALYKKVAKSEEL